MMEKHVETREINPTRIKIFQAPALHIVENKANAYMGNIWPQANMVELRYYNDKEGRPMYIITIEYRDLLNEDHIWSEERMEWEAAVSIM